MADLDKDGTNQGSLTGGTSTGLGEGLRVSTPQSTGTTSTYGATNTTSTSGTSGTSGTVSGMASKATETVKEGSARIADEAKQYAGDMANIAKEKSRTLFQEKKETAFGQVDSVTQAIRTTADQLQAQQPEVGKYVGMLADQIESFSSRLRQKDLDALINDTQDLARRSPGIFFAGAVVTGFLLSRFLKSSAQRPMMSSQMSDDEWSASSMTGDDNYATTGTVSTGTTGARGTTGSDFAGASGAAGGTTDSTTSGTLGTALGSTSTGTVPSSAGGTGTGGNTYDNR